MVSDIIRPDHDPLHESMAWCIFQLAIDTGQSGALLDCLFNGGSATVDAITGELLMVDAGQLAAMVPESDETDDDGELEAIVRDLAAAGATFMQVRERAKAWVAAHPAPGTETET